MTSITTRVETKTYSELSKRHQNFVDVEFDMHHGKFVDVDACTFTLVNGGRGGITFNSIVYIPVVEVEEINNPNTADLEDVDMLALLVG